MTERRFTVAGWLRRHWWVQGMLIVVIAAADLWIIVESDRVNHVDLDDALSEFRTDEPMASASSPSTTTTPQPQTTGVQQRATTSTTVQVSTDSSDSAAPPSPLTSPTFQPAAISGTARPAAGVYTYRTTGHETLGPGRHDYPERTHAIVRTTDCGWTFDHRIIEEHTDTYSYCVSDRTQLVGWDATREFLRVALDEHYSCSGEPWIPDRLNARSVVACTTGDEDRADLTFTRTPSQSITVDGTNVDALRVDVRADISGNPDGTLDAQLWIHATTGLRLREVRVVDAEVSAGGTSHYHEQVEFRIESLTPQQ